MKTKKEAIQECLNYIFDFEDSDYLEQCEENDWTYSNINNPHIYAAAHIALGFKKIEK